MAKRRSIGVCTHSASVFGIVPVYSPLRDPHTLGSKFAFEAKQGVWLHGLPEDVRHQIAVKVCMNKPCQDALHLAETSCELAESVARALSYRLCGWYFAYIAGPYNYVDVENEDPAELKRLLDAEESVRQRWISVMRPFVQETDGAFIELFDAPRIRKLVFRPLRKGTVQETRRLVSRFNSIRYRLDVVVLLDMSVDCLDQWAPLRFLAVLSPRKLVLSGDVVGTVFKMERGGVDRGRLLLSDACPLLERLELRSVWSKLDSKKLWNVLPCFPLLRELSISYRLCEERTWMEEGYHHISTMPSERVEWMSKLERLELDKLPNSAVDFAQQVGRCLPEFSADGITPQDIRRLKNNNFKKMNIGCQGAVEVALRDNVESFAALRVLSLGWSQGVECGYEVRICPFYSANLYATTEGAIFEFVIGLPHLRELKLLRIRIEVDELIGILSHLGCRLEIFASSIGRQNQPALDRYEALLRALGTYNPRLKHFDMAEWRVEVKRFTTELISQGKRIWKFTEILKRNARSLEAKNLDDYNERLLPKLKSASS